jgi:hypothetical protein
MSEWMTPVAIHSVCGARSGYPATNFIDDSTSIGWEHRHPHTCWIVVDLGQSYQVEQTRLYTWPTDDETIWQVFHVYVSNDPDNWGDPVGSSLAAENDSGWQYFELTPKVGRYVRFVITDTKDYDNDCAGRECDVLVSEVQSARPYSFIM